MAVASPFQTKGAIVLTSRVVGGVQHSDNIAFRTSHRLAVKATDLPPLEILAASGLKVIASWCIFTAKTVLERQMRSLHARSSPSVSSSPFLDSLVVDAKSLSLLLPSAAELKEPPLFVGLFMSATARLNAKFAIVWWGECLLFYER